MGHIPKRDVEYISDHFTPDVSFARVPTDIMLLIPCWGNKWQVLPYYYEKAILIVNPHLVVEQRWILRISKPLYYS